MLFFNLKAIPLVFQTRGSDLSGDRTLIHGSHYRVYRQRAIARRLEDESEDFEDRLAPALEESETKDIPALKSSEDWKIWKNMLISNKPKMHEFGNQLAIYMHCMLK